MDHRADPDRHSFLHSAECNLHWKRFVVCKNEHYILKYFGYCSTEYTNVLRCFKRERQQKKLNNHKLAMRSVNELMNDLIENNKKETK